LPGKSGALISGRGLMSSINPAYNVPHSNEGLSIVPSTHDAGSVGRFCSPLKEKHHEQVYRCHGFGHRCRVLRLRHSRMIRLSAPATLMPRRIAVARHSKGARRMMPMLRPGNSRAGTACGLAGATVTGPRRHSSAGALQDLHGIGFPGGHAPNFPDLFRPVRD